MLGFRYVKFDPTQHVILYRKGGIVREGAGLSFLYFSPSASLMAIPLGSMEAPFIFEETSRDFQDVTVQGQVTYRITDPSQAARLLNYTLDASGGRYVSKDSEKLQFRVINAVNVLVRSRIEHLTLREALSSGDSLVNEVTEELAKRTDIQSLGLEILGLSILAIKPNPETARALEAETREHLLKEADDAVYLRRNAAVEQERSIKENELRTEKAVQEKRHELESADTAHRIALEERRKELVELEGENVRTEADGRAYSLAAVVKSLAGADPKVVQALAGIGMQPDKLIASAMNELAANAGKIGELNIAPDMLRQLLRSGRNRGGGDE